MSYRATINDIESIRDTFAEMLQDKRFVTDKTGVKMLEILSAQFVADEDSIFGKVKSEYLEQELEWYLGQEQNIRSFPEPVPALWKSTAGIDGSTNSNYGWSVFSKKNYSQLTSVVDELRNNIHSRRAIMIYTRPSMHIEFDQDGKNDFICTNTVQYFIRENQVHAHVSMRSNDAVFGYKADYFWQKYVLNLVHEELLYSFPSLKQGGIIWNAGSLHVYERHFKLVQKYWETGEWK